MGDRSASAGSRSLLLPDVVITSAHAEPAHDAGVLVEADRIAAVGDRSALQRAAPTAPLVELPGVVLIPGFVDAHSHLRGLSTCAHGIEDAPLERWIVRLHAMAAVDPLADALVAAVGAVATGITTTQILHHTFADHDAYLASVRAAVAALTTAGLHAELVLGLTDQAEFVPQDVEAGLTPDQQRWLIPDRGVAVDGFAELVAAAGSVLDEQVSRIGTPPGGGAAMPWIRLGVAPVGPQWASDDLLAVVASLAGPERRVHTHALETRAQRRWGPDTPLERLARHGLLTPSTSIAHGVHLDDAEVALLSTSRVAVASCPTSNRNLADGVGDVVAWRDAGIDVAMGLDSNGEVRPPDAFEEMRALQRAARSLGRSLSSRDALEMATSGGAVAVGRADDIGAIAEGYRADLVAVRRPAAAQDPIDDLVRSATRADVTDVWSAGRRVVTDGRHVAHAEVVTAGERLDQDLERTAADRARVRAVVAELEPLVERIRVERSRS
jgi:5-methylthioadenosine/S-adenosylhomocysteine deaminase